MKQGKSSTNASSTTKTTISNPDKYKEMGNEAFKNRNFDRAIEYYSKAIELERNAIYYSNRAAAYFELEDYENSLKDAESCIEINPKFIKGYYRKALALREMDKLDSAIEILIKSKEVENNNKDIETLLENSMKEKNDESNGYKDNIEEEKVETLMQWLNSGNCYYPKLKIKSYAKNYRGVHAVRKIKVKEEILFIPKSHLITLEMAKETAVAKKMIEAQLDLLSPKHSFLSTFLLQEKNNQDSFWKPYLDLLPSNFETVPIFFSEEDLNWLEGSPFFDQVKEKKSDMKRDYDNICRVAPEFAQHSFHEFCWARLTASSRIFGICIGETKTDAFVPLADMLNHKRPKQTSWFYSNEKEGFIIESLEDIPRGEQVYDSYGKKCNSRFFLNYGFIVLDNDGNEVALKVTFKANDPCVDLKKKMMGEQLASKIFRVKASIEEDVVVEFLNFIRFTEIRDRHSLLEVMNVYENSLQKNEQDKEGGAGYKPQKTPPITIDVEMSVLERVKELCDAQLIKYSTTLKEDKELLASNKLTLNQRNCVLLRVGEKEILHYLSTFAEKCLPLLKLPSKHIRKAILQSPHNEYAEYIRRVLLPLMQNKEKNSE